MEDTKMKLRKVMAGVVSAAVALSATVISASAFADSYTATLGFADGQWAAQDWATTCEITGDGTYSITANCLFDSIDEDTGDEIKVAAAGEGINVFVIDIAQLGADLGLQVKPEGASDDDESWKYATGDVVVSDVTVTSGDTVFNFDQSKIKVGDIESKGNLRIELYNAYGPTCVNQAYDASISPIDPTTFAFAAEDQFTVTFTITGLDGADDTAEEEAPAAEDETAAPVEDTTADETPVEEAPAAEDETADEAPVEEAPAAEDETAAPVEDTTSDEAPVEEAPAAGDVDAATDSSKGSPDTGIADVAAVAGLAIVAGGAVLVSKKRK